MRAGGEAQQVAPEHRRRDALSAGRVAERRRRAAGDDVARRHRLDAVVEGVQQAAVDAGAGGLVAAPDALPLRRRGRRSGSARSTAPSRGPPAGATGIGRVGERARVAPRERGGERAEPGRRRIPGAGRRDGGRRATRALRPGGRVEHDRLRLQPGGRDRPDARRRVLPSRSRSSSGRWPRRGSAAGRRDLRPVELKAPDRGAGLMGARELGRDVGWVGGVDEADVHEAEAIDPVGAAAVVARCAPVAGPGVRRRLGPAGEHAPPSSERDDAAPTGAPKAPMSVRKPLLMDCVYEPRRVGPDTRPSACGWPGLPDDCDEGQVRARLVTGCGDSRSR